MTQKPPIQTFALSKSISLALQSGRVDWSKEENRQVYGSMSNTYGEGLNARLIVEWRARTEDEVSACRIAFNEICKTIDHFHWGREKTELAPLSTPERLIAWIAKELTAQKAPPCLVRFEKEPDDVFIWQSEL